MTIQSEFETIEKIADKSELSIERQIVGHYKSTLKDIKAVFSDLYSKYETGGKLTYAEMQKYNRLKATEETLKQSLAGLYRQTAKEMNTGLGSIYKSGYYRTAYALEKDLQARLGYLAVSPDKIKAAIQNPISGKFLNKILTDNRDYVISKLNQEITRGLIQGQSYGKMAKSITEVLGGDANKAMLIARTEAHRVSNQGKLESLKHADDAGVDMVKVWVATLDNRTRDAHQSLDGQEVGMDEDFVSSAGGRGPGPGQMGTAADDINCRCRFIVRVKGTKPNFRYVRGEGVVPYKTYDEWANNKGV